MARTEDISWTTLARGATAHVCASAGRALLWILGAAVIVVIVAAVSVCAFHG